MEESKGPDSTPEKPSLGTMGGALELGDKWDQAQQPPLSLVWGPVYSSVVIRGP